MANISEQSARREGCLPFQGDLFREGSHLGVAKRFGQNGPSLRQEALKYRHIPTPSFLTLSHFASNLDGTVYEFTA
ncbi:hypothetical protein [Altericroceibacterium endophyticum]|uniref:Uncharacterized protein n=1 Tax=Altericroceibacterium endophyticum TaxID=1808508 RepID=A0A6I4T9Q3_9SPHN|nr:hypothetical protein [Altericroceibacterium endophyticum]MXO66600.1 hypothetical protein [Altericroceibacterium endophyticum]